MTFPGLQIMGKMLMLLGGVLLVVGGVLYLGARGGIKVPWLPGDILYRKGDFTFFFPIVTCLILSLILTLLLIFFLSFRR